MRNSGAHALIHRAPRSIRRIATGCLTSQLENGPAVYTPVMLNFGGQESPAFHKYLKIKPDPIWPRSC